MNHSLGNNESLSRRKLNCVILKINQQLALYDIKELAVFLVPMPVIFTLDDAEADHRVIYLAECLVVPRILACIGRSLFINELQGFMKNIEARFVREGGSCCHFVFLLV